MHNRKPKIIQPLDKLNKQDSKLQKKVKKGKKEIPEVNQNSGKKIKNQHSIEESFKYSENLYQSIFENANEGIVLYDADTLKPIDINPRAHLDLGYTREEFFKLNQKDFTIYSHPEQQIELINKLYKKGRIEYPIKHKSKNGEIFHRNISASIININQKKYVLGIINDVTQLKETENKLVEANKQIVAMNRKLEKRIKLALKDQQDHYQYLLQKSKLESLGELAAGIAHEINQPLGILSLSFENLHSKIISKNATPQYLETKFQSIDSNIKRIREIIEHVKIFSRDQEMPVLDKISINKVLRNALSLVKAQYNNHNIKIILQLKEEIGFTVGSKIKLEQAIMNLLSNAKYSVEEKAVYKSEHEYSMEIRIKTDSKKNQLYLSIEDNGIGIKDEYITRIFDPFFTTKPEGIGTGLGLSIVYGIIKEMYGEIGVKSKEGEFTKFEIFLPRFPENN